MRELIHRFELNGRRFAVDTETCFCFECDEISWDVLEHYPFNSATRIAHLLADKHPRKEVDEVAGELEWLRATKSILQSPKIEDQQKLFEFEKGLKKLTVLLGAETKDIAETAINLLLNRAGAQKNLYLELRSCSQLSDAKAVAGLVEYALKAARLAAKNLTVAVAVSDVVPAKVPKALEGHSITLKMEFKQPGGIAAQLKPLTAPVKNIAKTAKALQASTDGVRAVIRVRPGHPDFGDVAEELDKAGFKVIELDLEGSFAENPETNPAAMVAALGKSAQYYAKCLLKRHYFRLDPIAPLFWQIYNGKPTRRSDPAGTNELAVAADGTVYPSALFIGRDEFNVGSISSAELDEKMLKTFDDVGSLTTDECIRCWARNLCGGGTAAVHNALSGSFRKPNKAWCDAQRSWMMAAVSAFSILSSQGVNFSRVYNNLDPTTKPSLLKSTFAVARAALSMNMSMRPIEEEDAEMLTNWENWNEAAYFLCNEKGLFLATQYDREMDSLHPRGIEKEFMLTRKNGQALGLLKVRPERSPGTATAWIYMNDPQDYESDSIHKSFKFIIKQAAAGQSFKRILVPASSQESGLQSFLEAIGFEELGIQREAMYLHRKYYDVHVYMGDLA